MSKLPSISRLKQWADAQFVDASATDDERDVATFLVKVLGCPGMTADKLSAIQRSFAPIDDAGTLRMLVDRRDVDALLDEVVRLRAESVAATVEYVSEQVIETRDNPATVVVMQPEITPRLLTADEISREYNVPVSEEDE